MYLSLNKLRSHCKFSAFTARLPQRRLLTNPVPAHRHKSPTTSTVIPLRLHNFMYTSLEIKYI
jgi:hypothetical protein